MSLLAIAPSVSFSTGGDRSCVPQATGTIDDIFLLYDNLVFFVSSVISDTFIINWKVYGPRGKLIP